MRAETALTSAPNSHGACHDLALGPVPTQNARLEEREGVPPTPARARAIRSTAPTGPPSSRPSPTMINPPQARASRALQVSQARRRPQVSPTNYPPVGKTTTRIADPTGSVAPRGARGRPRPRPFVSSVSFTRAEGGRTLARGRSRTPDRPQRASQAPQPHHFKTRAPRTNPFSRRRRPRRLTRAYPSSSPTTHAAMDPTRTTTRRTSTSCTRCCAWSATRRRARLKTRILRSRRRIEPQTQTTTRRRLGRPPRTLRTIARVPARRSSRHRTHTPAPRSTAGTPRTPGLMTMSMTMTLV